MNEKDLFQTIPQKAQAFVDNLRPTPELFDQLINGSIFGALILFVLSLLFLYIFKNLKNLSFSTGPLFGLKRKEGLFKKCVHILFIFIYVIFALVFGLIRMIASTSRVALRAVAMASLGFACVLIWGSYIEPQKIVVRDHSLLLCESKSFVCKNQKITIALIADMHLGPYKNAEFMQKVVDRIVRLDEAEEIDAILIPGDIVYSDAKEAKHMQPFSMISIPTYITLGNHDFNKYEQGVRVDPTLDEGVDSRSSEIEKYLKEAFSENKNIHILRDEIVYLELEGKNSQLKNSNNIEKPLEAEKIVLEIIGQEDWWSRPFQNVEQILTKHNNSKKLKEKDVSILLQHNPDGVFFQDLENVDLVVSGHTHGGQIRLPFIGAMWPVPTQIGNAFDQGYFKVSEYYKDLEKVDFKQKLFENKKTHLYITSGLGETGPRARLFNPPEIVILDINF